MSDEENTKGVKLFDKDPETDPLMIPDNDWSDKAHTEERRLIVHALTEIGWTQAKIAERLEVHINTVNRDVQTNREAAVSAVQNEDPNVRLGQTLQTLDRIRQRAMTQAETTRDGRLKVSSLNTALRATMARAELMMESGLIPRAAKKLNLGVIAKRTEEDLKRTKEDKIARLRELGLDPDKSSNLDLVGVTDN